MDKQRKSEYDRLYYLRNRAKRLAQVKQNSLSHMSECAARNKSYYLANRTALIARQKERYLRNRAEIRAYQRAYYLANIDKLHDSNRAYRLRKMSEDPVGFRAKESAKHRRLMAENIDYRLRSLLRRRLNHALHGQTKVGSAVGNLGCSVSGLRYWLEKHFEPGMSWANYGKGVGKWNIDHVRPLASFDLTDAAQLKDACHFTNLEPIWSIENSRKGAQTVEVN